MYDLGKVLIVDDNPSEVRVLSALLKRCGYNVVECFGVVEAIGVIEREGADVVVSDIRMPDRDGYFLLRFIKDSGLYVPVIFLTAYGTVDSAVQAIKSGAFYYFVKPSDCEKLKQIIGKALELRRLNMRLSEARLSGNENDLKILGKTAEMLKLYETIRAVRDSESNVLVCGETGTGKELAARAIHYSGRRKDRPFVAVNCASIPKELLEAELFGYERGAFTGAFSRKTGKLEEAGGGTVFLDEIGELDHVLQAKLLRVLENKEVVRLGGNKSIALQFRLVSSTNRDLKEEVRLGNFREDLYYRINVIKISLAPLREREEDIPLLVSEFFGEFCSRENKRVLISEEVMDVLKGYHWPGNIRQLRNIIERAVVLSNGENITIASLPDEIVEDSTAADNGCLLGTLKELERQAVLDALQRCTGNKSKAARMLGISRKAFYKRLNAISPTL